MAESAARRVERDLHMLSAIVRRVMERPTGGGDGATFAQTSILRWLDRAGPRRSGDVAKFLSASAPAATQMLARLETKGLVTMRRDPDDRRVQEVSLTDRGREIVREHDRERGERLDRLFGGLSSARLTGIAGALEEAIEALLRDDEGTEDLCLHCGALASPDCVLRRHGRRCPIEATDSSKPPAA